MQNPQEIFAFALFGTACLSHTFRPSIWKQFIAWFAAQGTPGVMLYAMLYSLPGAALLALAHTDTWIGIAFTVIAVMFVFKGALYLTFPEFGLRTIQHGLKLSDRKWGSAGVFFAALALLAAWGAFA